MGPKHKSAILWKIMILSENLVAAYLYGTLSKIEKKQVLSLLSKAPSDTLLDLNISAACFKAIKDIENANIFVDKPWK